jgi:hypothetical protein
LTVADGLVPPVTLAGLTDIEAIRAGATTTTAEEEMPFSDAVSETEWRLVTASVLMVNDVCDWPAATVTED